MSMDPDQPPRKKVKHYDNGEPHFLTFSCYRCLPLLSKDRTRQWFVEALEEARAVHGFQLWAWVIMPEHVHVLLWPPFHLISSDPRSTRGRISGILSSIKRPVGEKAVSYLSEHSPDFLKRLTVTNATRTYHRFWQAGSGHDENVSEPSALHALVEYIHLNPVRRGLVTRPEDWPWSSTRDWLRLPNAILNVDRTLPATLDIPWTSHRPERGA
jgi:REP-associated tyrosine transposase